MRGENEMKRKELMKTLKLSGLSLVIASSLLISGCGCGNPKNEKDVAIATEVSKDTDEKGEKEDTKDTVEEKNTEKDELQVTEEAKAEEAKDSDSKDEKSDKADTDKSGTSGSSSNSSSGNSGSTGNGGSSNSGNTNSGNTSNGGNSNSGNTSNGGNSSGGTSSSTTPTPTHTHNWIPITQTIHHPAETRQEDQGHYKTIVDQAAYDEEVPIMEYDHICITCYRRGSIVRLHSQSEVNSHLDYHYSIGDSSCQYGNFTFQNGTETVHHEAVTHQEWVSNIVTVTVKEAWDEVVTVGYQCSECGATK